MRSLLMVFALASAYLLLRGYPETWPSVVRTCLAVLGLVAGIGIWGRRRPEEGEVLESRRRSSWVDYVSIGAAVLAVECLFLVFFSAAPGPLESAAEKVEEWIRPEVAAARKIEKRTHADAQRGNWLWNDELRRPLPVRTNFKQGNRPEIFLRPRGESDAARMLDSRLYVQAFALGRYDEAAWMAPEGAEVMRLAEDDGWLRLRKEREGQSVSCRVYQGGEKRGQNPLAGLQGLIAARVDAVTRVDEGLLLLPERDGGYEYDTISRPRIFGDLKEDQLRIPEEFPDTLLCLHSGGLGLRIREQADAVVGKGDVSERLTRIQDYLRKSLAYSLVTENPDNRDPLENFMFYEKRGHCELFASAGAMLARASGIPSRIGYGWLGGTYYESSRLFVFRAREAHAWTEVFLEDHGWVVLDPTPPTALLRSSPEVASSGEQSPGLDEFENGEESGLKEGRPVWLIGLGLSVFFGIPSIAMFAWRASRLRSDESWVLGSVAGRGRDGYIGAFVSECRRRGVRVEPGRTLRCLVAELEDVPEFAEELVQYYYEVQYEGGARFKEKERSFSCKIEAWARP